MPHPPGLKVYRDLLSAKEIEEILSHQEFQEVSIENPQMFRLYGDFGAREVAAIRPWMHEWGQRIQERNKVFSRQPNQYRVCDWMGELSGNFKWHIDNKSHGSKILVINLTNGRQIGFRENSKSQVYKLEVNEGDAYLMKGASRWQWEHRVIPTGRERTGGRSFILSYKGSSKS